MATAAPHPPSSEPWLVGDGGGVSGTLQKRLAPRSLLGGQAP